MSQSKATTHKRFIRAASAIVRSWNVDKYDQLPQNLSECSEQNLALQAFIYSDALLQVAKEEALAYAQGKENDMTRTPKIKKLIKAYKSGYIPNRL